MHILQMSVAGGVMIVAIIIARALLLDKLPKKTFLLLWGLVLFRLLIPVRIPSSYSIYSWIQGMTGATGTSQEGSPWALPVWGMGGAGAGPEVLAGPGTGPWTGMERDLVALGQASSGWQIWPLPWLLWVVGLAVCVAVFSGIYIRCLREFKMSLPLQNACTENWLESHRLRRKLQIRQSDRVGTPISYGILRPVILLPKSMDWGNSRSMEHILEHELVHIQRFDLVGKLLVLAGVCVHWFNPLAWVMWVLFNRDVELTCDEEVVRNLGEDARSAYAMTLIGMEEGKLGKIEKTDPIPQEPVKVLELQEDMWLLQRHQKWYRRQRGTW